MAQFNLVHCLLHPTKPHGLLGYTEVIETVAWGLAELGHEVKRSVNQPEPQSINILFGAQVLSPHELHAFPENSIIYNFEQLRHVPPSAVRPEFHAAARRFRIWDYSLGNADAWKDLGALKTVRIVPLGYAPLLTRIPVKGSQDIDVLIYGGVDDKRLRIFRMLADAGLSTVFACGLYGESRDSLIARAKLILNTTRYDQSRIFEVVRVSYLLANKKAVISVSEDDLSIEDDIKAAVRFTSEEQLVQNCRVISENDGIRHGLEAHGFDVFSRRDIRHILSNALGNAS